MRLRTWNDQSPHDKSLDILLVGNSSFHPKHNLSVCSLKSCTPYLFLKQLWNFPSQVALYLCNLWPNSTLAFASKLTNLLGGIGNQGMGIQGDDGGSLSYVFAWGLSFREGRRDVHVWSPNPSLGFSCNSLFTLLLDPFPSREFVFYVVWRIKVFTKLRIFIWQVLLGSWEHK